METIVISLGGSVINTGKLNISLIKNFGDLLIKLNKQKKTKFAVICGGGKLFRNLLFEVKKYSNNKISFDWLGIHCTRVNAQCVLAYFISKKTKTCVEVSLSSDQSVKLLSKYDFVFQGGDKPGYTSDMDAVELAVLNGKHTKLINISNVDGIYTADPNKYKSAEKISKMTHKELSALILKSGKGYKSGQNIVFDQMATKLAQKHNIELHFISAKNLKDVEKIIQGKAHKGTIVKN